MKASGNIRNTYSRNGARTLYQTFPDAFRLKVPLSQLVALREAFTLCSPVEAPFM
jgi:hypothetical protein